MALQGVQGKKQTSSGLAPHFKRNLDTNKGNQEAATDTVDYLLPHPIWSKDEVQSVIVTHKEPEERSDKLAYYAVQMTRFGFDTFSGFSFGKRTEAKWLRRIIFLETVAGVPGMVGGMLRHLRSLRRMERDHGWIHTLLEEAENERMHLMTALELKKPSKFFTLAVLGAQGIFVNIFFVAYLISPCFCHRFVGYLEEEAVKTYTMLIQEIDDGTMAEWQNKASPDIATKYWKLQPDAMMRDVILAIRADEAHHRDVNHTLGTLNLTDQNPFPPGK
ncbi:alternative oxidase, mitochondrial-like isoform X2 [Anneissia japonica]|nr:alternative oxidase, mitochondrial-like isoform X2 [Anneissia japonica]